MVKISDDKKQGNNEGLDGLMSALDQASPLGENQEAEEKAGTNPLAAMREATEGIANSYSSFTRDGDSAPRDYDTGVSDPSYQSGPTEGLQEIDLDDVPLSETDSGRFAEVDVIGQRTQSYGVVSQDDSSPTLPDSDPWSSSGASDSSLPELPKPQRDTMSKGSGESLLSILLEGERPTPPPEPPTARETPRADERAQSGHTGLIYTVTDEGVKPGEYSAAELQRTSVNVIPRRETFEEGAPPMIPQTYQPSGSGTQPYEAPQRPKGQLVVNVPQSNTPQRPRDAAHPVLESLVKDAARSRGTATTEGTLGEGSEEGLFDPSESISSKLIASEAETSFFDDDMEPDLYDTTYPGNRERKGALGTILHYVSLPLTIPLKAIGYVAKGAWKAVNKEENGKYLVIGAGLAIAGGGLALSSYVLGDRGEEVPQVTEQRRVVTAEEINSVLDNYLARLNPPRPSDAGQPNVQQGQVISTADVRQYDSNTSSVPDSSVSRASIADVVDETATQTQDLAVETQASNAQDTNYQMSREESISLAQTFLCNYVRPMDRNGVRQAVRFDGSDDSLTLYVNAVLNGGHAHEDSSIQYPGLISYVNDRTEGEDPTTQAVRASLNENLLRQVTTAYYEGNEAFSDTTRLGAYIRTPGECGTPNSNSNE